MKSTIRGAVCIAILYLANSCPGLGQEGGISESGRKMDEGVRLYSAGDLDGAITALRRSVADWPKNSLAYFNLGLALADKGDLEAAGKAYEQAIALMEAPVAPGGARARTSGAGSILPEALNNLALVYYQQNRMDDAALR